MYKLITIDLDGTLLNDHHEIPERVQQTINKAKEQGVKIVLCTGRPIGGVQTYLKQLQLNGDDDYVIAYNGALVQKTRTKEAVVELSLHKQDLEQLYGLSVTLDTSMHFFDAESVYTPNENISQYTVLESFLNGIPLRYRNIDNIPSDMLIPKIMFINDPVNLERIKREIPSNLYEQFTIVQSSPYFLEFVHPEASKGNAVKQLAEQLGIKQDEVMSIGDNGNDLSMIKYAGCGVAMKNAIPEIKDAADYETLTNNDGGVAHAIEKLVLDPLR